MEKFWVRKGIEPSEQERLIAKKLSTEKIKFLQEVCFQSCRSPATGNHLRYDFYLPDLNVLIEYDGRGYHESEFAVERDMTKDKYAKDWRLHLIRIKNSAGIDAAIQEIIKIKRSGKKKSKKKLPEQVIKKIKYKNACKERQAAIEQKSKRIQAERQKRIELGVSVLKPINYTPKKTA